MPSPTPTPTPGIPELILGFFWYHWLGQLLLGAAILGVIGWVFRTWIKSRIQQFVLWLRDLRLTRRSMIDKEIASAVAASEAEWESRVADVRVEGAQALERLRERLTPSTPAVVTPEEAAAMRDERRHRRSVEDQWVISTNRSRRHGYILRNYAAREATGVSLTAAFRDSFEFIDPPEWHQVSEGHAVGFKGRISNPDTFQLMNRELQVSWTDDHGDQQTKRVQVDRDDSRPRPWR